MALAEARPCTVFTSMGKKVMMTTTATFDCQSKPNHMTMIGATPTIGSAETEIADRQQALLQEGRAVDEDGDDEAEAAAGDITGDHRLEKVWLKSAHSVGSELISRAQIMLGAGACRIDGT